MRFAYLSFAGLLLGPSGCSTAVSSESGAGEPAQNDVVTAGGASAFDAVEVAGAASLAADAGPFPALPGEPQNMGDAAVPLDTVSSSDAAAPRDSAAVRYERQVLTQDFVAEGATFGDFNNDGAADVVAGSHWYEGPEFVVSHAFRPPVVFDPLGYSDNFFAYNYDFNQDGWEDVLIYGFPGESAAWFENPQGAEVNWARHILFAQVDNEAPAFVNLTGSEAPELVFNSGGNFGWAGLRELGDSSALEFHAISDQGDWQRYTHGLGVGDVNGDGLKDILSTGGFWLQPSQASAGSEPWPFEAHTFGLGGAQMFTYDVDADGDQDVISSVEAHGYGLSWFEQTTDGAARVFIEHPISGTPDSPLGTSLHEPHALALVDVDGDSVLDIVSGERFWGHVPEEPEFDAPALLVWFRLVREQGGPRYEEHVIDTASGVGTQVVARRLGSARAASIVVANKKGVFVFQATL